MNIKRAFFAAAAVLAMPGLAMAQSTHTFDTTFTAGTNEAANVILTCNSGFPQSQPATTPFNFSVNSVSDGATCTIAIDGELSPGFVVTDYTTEEGSSGTSPCSWTINAATAVNHTCAITAEVTETDFNVTVEWDFTDIADPDTGEADTDIGQAAEVIVRCQNAWNGFTLTTVSQSFPAGPDAQFPLALPVTPNPDTAGVATVCDAGLDPLTIESAVAADEQECGSVIVTAGGMGACTIFATVFFEGIPTLSQYGMAIMALLMLGVGFVGFRRFV